jgi:glucosyl-3-phosphoglycerate synthase
VELGILVDVLRAVGLPAMAQVDLGARQNRHQSLWDLTLMSSVVLRAMTRRARGPQRGAVGSGNPRVRPLRRSDTYVHAVATEDGLRLDEHVNVLLERPPLANVLAADRDQDTVA